MGRKSSVTSPHRQGSGFFSTSYTYDPLGRPLTITAPDGTLTTYARTGNTSTTRTLQIAQTAGQSDAQSTEYTDHLGRLIQVDEPSGTNPNNPTSTIYHYDVGDRLPLVQSGVQIRSFVYDDRVQLVSEEHTE